MASSSLIATTADAFGLWLEQAGRDRIGTDVAFHGILAKCYPGYHITRVLSNKCDLAGFAKAGNATRTVDLSPGFDAVRMYKAPKLRQDKGKDKIEDDTRFAAWHYEYQGTAFLVYEMSYYDYFFSRLFHFYYILVPPSVAARADAVGHHPDTDGLLLAAGKWTRDMHEEIWVFDDQEWKKDKELYRSVQGVTWDDVILDERLKTNLMHDVESFFDNRELYYAMQVPWKRGVILHGVPGNGKTVSIKALINSLAARSPPVPAMYVKSLDGCQSPKALMQRVFAKARVVAPCLLIFEDLDSLVEDKTRHYFLNEVDGLDSNEGILMIGSTNHLSQLDPAITRRPSRFDRKYHFKVPDEAARVAYCRYWQKKFANPPASTSSSSPAIDFPDDICAVMAKLTEGFSFAYIKELFVTSLLAVARRQEGIVDQDEGGSDSSSNSGVVVVDKEDMKEGQDSNKAEEKSDANIKKADGKKKPNKPKRLMPEVEVPESLRDNVFMNAVLAEASILWEQMDNSEEEAIKLKKAAATCVESRFPYPRFGEDDD